MGQPRRLSFPHNPDEVKSCSVVVELETRKIMEGSHDDLALLSLLDRGERVSELLRTMRPDLNKNNRSSILRNKINFSARVSIISLNSHRAEVA